MEGTLKKILSFLLILLAVCAVCAVAWVFGRNDGYKAGYEAGIGDIRRDTVVVVDTVFHDRPVPVEKWREKTVYIAVTDTQIVHTTDSVFVAVEREAKRYSDKDYECVVSGVQPSLDWIKVYPTTTTITETVMDKRRWTFGVTAGPGVLYDGSIHGGIGIVAGLQYRF